ncbi:6-bladed beta-propeller [Rhodothermus profundi]|nr:6-bladed beta-propeller [Rhodothermus profundi]
MAILFVALPPSYCLAQTWTASFSTEWTVGTQETKPHFFRFPEHLITDRQGYVYIHDYGDTRLRVFDANGRFVKYIGRKGQGPGEFESISLFFVDANNRLYVNDPINGRITIYADAARTTFHTRPRPPLMIRQVLPLSADSLLLVGRHRTRKDDCILFLTNSAFRLSQASCLARASLFWSPEDPLYAMQTFRSAIRVAYREGVLMAAPWLYEGVLFRLERHRDQWQATQLTGLHPGKSAYTKLPDGTAPWDLPPSEKNNVSFFSGPYGRLALRIHRRSLGVFALANGGWGHFSIDQQHDPPIGFLEIWDGRGQYLGYAELQSPPYDILWKEPDRDTFYLLRWQEDLPVIEKARLRLRPKR